ncbi:MAG: hypothetical protein AUI58_04760 [Chloroflexi bacterium 13_1_40CM_2_70_6]|nr:MAG: hypothetical protein AUI58_04760 [Chloroflexi bacterium 13_1_40CM_2_70_6]
MDRVLPSLPDLELIRADRSQELALELEEPEGSPLRPIDRGRQTCQRALGSDAQIEGQRIVCS